MARKKKSFINKKKVVDKFKLVPVQGHGVQPAPNGSEDDDDVAVEETSSAQRRWEVQAAYGIEYHDNYDYLKHLRPIQDMVELVPVAMSVDRSRAPDELDAAAEPNEHALDMLSQYLEDAELDPDIVAALASDNENDDDDDGLDDDFVHKADAEPISNSFTQHRDTKNIPKVDNASRQRGSHLNKVDEDNDWETDDSDEEEDDDDFFNDGKKSTGKKPAIRLKPSRPTHFDEQFEKIVSEYKDDNDDADFDASDDDAEPPAIMSTDGIVDMAEEYLQKKIDEKLRLRILQWDMFFRTQIHDALELKCERRLVVVEDDDALAYDPLKIAARDKDDKWDCESILTANSILYNHPTLISESSGGKRPRDKIELDRFGRPVVGSGGALTAKKLRTLDKAVHDDSDSDGTMDTCTSRASTLRPRDETAEQRRLRKAAVRAERRERRVEKKANTIAFKDEAHRQAVQRTTNTQTKKGVILVV